MYIKALYNIKNCGKIGGGGGSEGQYLNPKVILFFFLKNRGPMVL